MLFDATGSGVVAFAGGFLINGLLCSAVLFVPLLIGEALRNAFDDR
jgi:hypothetical protein